MPLVPSSSWTFSIDRVSSCFVVASCTAVVYDWALTFGQEFELVWRQRRSLMSALYISVRYIGIIYSVNNMLLGLPGVLMTDLGCNIINFALMWASFIVNSLLGVVMISRLHAMYERSRRILIFLLVIFFAVTIACGTMAAIASSSVSVDVLVLFGTSQCVYKVDGGEQRLMAGIWILATIWEVVALGLAVWIVVKHFRELQPPSTGWTIEDCFTVLIKTHVLYFAAFAAVSCFSLGFLSPMILNSSSVGAQIYCGILQLVTLMQMFVVGPRLVLSIREYHAKLVTKSEEGTTIATMVFQEHTQVSSDSDV